jgi:hypothetical protein
MIGIKAASRDWAIALATGLAVAMAPLAVADPADHTPEIVASFQLGKADDQIGVWWPYPGTEHEGGRPSGPKSFAVTSDGSLVVSDRVNTRVKKFDLRTGALLAATDVPLRNLHGVVSGPQGEMYAVSGAGLNRLTRFEPSGALSWQVRPYDLARRHGCFSGMSMGADGLLAVELSEPELALALVDSGTAELIRVTAGNLLSPSGQIYRFAPHPTERNGVHVEICDLDGTLLSVFDAPSEPVEPALYDGVSHGLSGGFVGGDGRLYTIAHASRGHRVALSERITLVTDVIVSQYGAGGRLVGHLRFPADPFPAVDCVEVDSDGNLYHLSYDETSVSLIRYRLIPERDTVRRLVELPLRRGDGKAYVPLRSVADYKGYETAWDPANECAIVRAPAEQGPGVVVARVSVRDGDATLHNGRVWVSVEVAKAKLCPTLVVDDSRRVACLRLDAK